ncbi:MAG: alanine--tRNA ligase [Candidatus Dasytiphilus stammeri]
MKYHTAEIRQTFIDYFQMKDHKVVASSSLIPENDSSLLFTNAGMNQFKNIFINVNKSDLCRATTAQRCIRAGGKHNDLEKVGFTTRHHTFFEMLGNFSFGDYFKREAINFAWELLTSKYWFHLPQEKLWVTVYYNDNETYDIWANEINIPSDRLIRIGDYKNKKYSSDNFWTMGNTGPCGPCTEIFFDHGAHLYGGDPGSTEDGNRYIEIWNIVFIQYNRQEDGSLEVLTNPSVDTGMGLERMAAVLQHVDTTYDIDVFKKIIKNVGLVTNTTNIEAHKSPSIKVIADHIRSCTFLIGDGVQPSNEGRGYVLRHIIRRAVRHGYMLGMKEPFFYKLVKPMVDIMEKVSEYIIPQQDLIQNILKTEEKKFFQTLVRGLSRLNITLENMQKNQILDGKTIFNLYDTYGLPIEMIADVCRERNIQIDKKIFNQQMELQRTRARQSQKFTLNYNHIVDNYHTIFQGHDIFKLKATIIAIFIAGKTKESINYKEEGIIILDKTPFYSESGGQIGDSGKLLLLDRAEFIVHNTKKIGNVIAHIGILLHGSMHIGDYILAQIDKAHRKNISMNHSATHLLHTTLRIVLGDHIRQKGSFISDKYLRFDFYHPTSIEDKIQYKIEKLVNTQIRNNLPITTSNMRLNDAKKRGAIALFSDKYEKYVRVLKIGDFSLELCNGTHVSRTGEIGLFHITHESSVAYGIRRIEAITGDKAIEKLQFHHELIQNISRLIKANHNNIYKKILNIINNNNSLKREREKFKFQQASQTSKLLINDAIKVKNTHLLISQLMNFDIKILKSILLILKDKLQSSVIILSTVNDGQVNLMVSVTSNISNIITAKEIICLIAPLLGGKGGGKTELAQAYGTNIKELPKIMNQIEQFVTNKLLDS